MRSQQHNAAGYGPSQFAMNAHGRVVISGLPTEFLQRGDALVAIGNLLSAEPPQRMPDTAVTGVVDIVRAEDMKPGRQKADTQPVPPVHDHNVVLIGTYDVAT